MPAKLSPAALAARFWENVQKTDTCWVWVGRCDEKGYGYASRDQRAHRLAYELCVGPIPAGLYVCHRCDNRACVRPDHLFLGTQLDNMQDMVRKGRARPRGGESNGRALLTAQDVRDIRALCAAGWTGPQLAARYGVSVSCIRYIRIGRNWAHVT